MHCLPDKVSLWDCTSTKQCLLTTLLDTATFSFSLNVCTVIKFCKCDVS